MNKFIIFILGIKQFRIQSLMVNNCKIKKGIFKQVFAIQIQAKLNVLKWESNVDYHLIAQTKQIRVVGINRSTWPIWNQLHRWASPTDTIHPKDILWILLHHWLLQVTLVVLSAQLREAIFHRLIRPLLCSAHIIHLCVIGISGRQDMAKIIMGHFNENEL